MSTDVNHLDTIKLIVFAFIDAISQMLLFFFSFCALDRKSTSKMWIPWIIDWLIISSLFLTQLINWYLFDNCVCISLLTYENYVSRFSSSVYLNKCNLFSALKVYDSIEITSVWVATHFKLIHIFHPFLLDISYWPSICIILPLIRSHHLPF